MASTSIGFRRSTCRRRMRRIPITSLRHGAVELFVARTNALEPNASRAEDLAQIAAICRRLDGIPPRHRVRRRAGRHSGHTAGCRWAQQSLLAVDRRAPHRAGAAPDTACGPGLELCAAAGSGTAVAASSGCLPRRLHASMPRGDGHARYRRRCIDRHGWHREPRREVIGRRGQTRCGHSVGKSARNHPGAYGLRRNWPSMGEVDNMRGGMPSIFAICSDYLHRGP